MSRGGKDDLHTLVQSLTKAEKRLVKLRLTHSPQAVNSNLQPLFSYLCRINNYDDNKLKKQFSGKRFIKHLSSTKFKLMEIILQVLSQQRMYQNDQRNSAQIMAAEILISKGLERPANKLLQRTYKKASERQDYLIMAQTAQLQRQLICQIEQKKGVFEKISSLNQQEAGALQWYTLQSEWRIFYNELESRIMINFRFRDDTVIKHYLKHLDSLIKKTGKQPESAFVQILIPAVKGLIFQAQGLHKEAAKFFVQSLNLWRKYHTRINLPDVLIFKILFHLAENRFYSGSPLLPQEKRALDELENMVEQSSQESIAYLILSKLTHYVASAQFDKADLIRNDYRRNTTSQWGFYYRMRFFYLMVLRYLFAGDYGNGLYWLNEIRQMPRSDFGIDIRNSIRLLELIFHYELDNLDTINYLLRSVSRKLYPYKNQYLFESICYHFLRDLIRTIGSGQLPYLLANSCYQMEELAARQPNQPIGFEEILLWLQSKVNNIPISRIHRAHFGLNNKG